ncbi:fasciclin-like arabinogalactan protein 12 [Ziziphus jujuba]|uniref:Fasciclin-like arabinogalactan protein 12 n=1 Tax=Ziziphus jujuba TaxID=326968 RepID=A0A6P3Z9X6_ZIZJJ|nr:fasciclin-like arabinogalactan protein 12 [Ziziphus jujuba]
MSKQLLISLPILLVFIYLCTSTVAQSPAQAPSAQAKAHAPTAHAPSAQAKAQPAVQPPIEVPLVQAPPHKALTGPTNVTKILEKAGGFSVFIRILKSTQVINQVETELNNSNNALTIFAPTNDAFSGLKPGLLNSLSIEQKVQLLEYHFLPAFVPISSFQTVSNPVRTQASDTYEYPLNITTTGSIVNISTGIVNTTISGTVYTDNQLAIYKVDRVLLPLGVFAPRPRPPAPAPAAGVKKPNKDESPFSPVAAVDASAGVSFTRNGMVSIGVAFAAAVFVWSQF